MFHPATRASSTSIEQLAVIQQILTAGDFSRAANRHPQAALPHLAFCRYGQVEDSQFLRMTSESPGILQREPPAPALFIAHPTHVSRTRFIRQRSSYPSRGADQRLNHQVREGFAGLRVIIIPQGSAKKPVGKPKWDSRTIAVGKNKACHACQFPPLVKARAYFTDFSGSRPGSFGGRPPFSAIGAKKSWPASHRREILVGPCLPCC